MSTPVVDEELCIGCGVCAELCPEVFTIRNDKSWVIGPERCGTCDCEEAVAACPVTAIALIED